MEFGTNNTSTTSRMIASLALDKFRNAKSENVNNLLAFGQGRG